MKLNERESAALRGDTSKEAIAKRLTAARIAAGYTQADFADFIGVPVKTYNSQEKRGAPSMSAMRALYRNHGIDFNFVLHGDFVHLPAHLQAALFDALDDVERRPDRRTS